MFATVLTVHDGLGRARRLPSIAPRSQSISALELGSLFLMGAAAAVLSAYVKLSLAIPGHNIIRVIFPMALGLALVPRRGSASVMAMSGLATAGMIGWSGTHGIGAGALTSLTVTGLLLDLALTGARSGRSVYLRLAAAGVAANMVAFLIKAGEKALTSGVLEGVFYAPWLRKALVTYPLCGLLAGLVSAAVWFRVTAAGDGRQARDEAGA